MSAYVSLTPPCKASPAAHFENELKNGLKFSKDTPTPAAIRHSLKLLVYEALSYSSLARIPPHPLPFAYSLKLLVYEALRYQCMRS